MRLFRTVVQQLTKFRLRASSGPSATADLCVYIMSACRVYSWRRLLQGSVGRLSMLARHTSQQNRLEAVSDDLSRQPHRYQHFDRIAICIWMSQSQTQLASVSRRTRCYD